MRCYMNKKEKKDLKKELAEGVEHLQKQSVVDTNCRDFKSV